MDCLFCKFATKEIPVEFVYDSETVFAINDINPQAPVHILIIPKGHYKNAPELAITEANTLAEMFEASSGLAKVRGVDSFRTVFNTGAGAGQSVFHAHLHLLGGRDFTWPPG